MDDYERLRQERRQLKMEHENKFGDGSSVVLAGGSDSNNSVVSVAGLALRLGPEEEEEEEEEPQGVVVCRRKSRAAQVWPSLALDLGCIVSKQLHSIHQQAKPCPSPSKAPASSNR